MRATVALLIRIIFAPAVFVIAGALGVWTYVIPARKDEMEDGRQIDHDMAIVAPEDNEEDKLRSYGREQDARDKSPYQRNCAVEQAQIDQQKEMPPHPVPFDLWCIRRNPGLVRRR